MEDPETPPTDLENPPAVAPAAVDTSTAVEDVNQATSNNSASDPSPAPAPAPSMDFSDKATVVKLMEQDEVDRQQKLQEQERSVQHRETVAAIAQDDKLHAKAARNASNVPSVPGAHGSQPTTNTAAAVVATANTSFPDQQVDPELNQVVDSEVAPQDYHEYSMGGEEIPDDEEMGGIDKNKAEMDDGGELLVHAELVEDPKEVEPKETYMKDAELLVDAEILETSPEMVKRRRMIRTLSIVTCVVILVAVIVLSVSLTQAGGGSSSSQFQVASSAPTVSLPPSTQPSAAPSSVPSNVPSQAPTRLLWEAVQSLDGLRPIIVFEDNRQVPLGGQRFGTSLFMSDILNTPLANRTDRSILAAVQFTGDVAIAQDGGLQYYPTGVAIYLCGDSDNNNDNGQENLEFCELVSIIESRPVLNIALSGTFLLVISDSLSDAADYAIFDLSDNIDLEGNTLSPTRSGSLSILPSAVTINSDGTRFVHVSTFRKELINYGEPIAVAPVVVLPPLIVPIGPGPVISLPTLPTPTEPIGPPLELTNPPGVYQLLPTDPVGFPLEVFWTVAMTNDVIVTINAVDNPNAPSPCLGNFACLFYGSYKIYHTNHAFENTLPPLHVDDDSSSVFSTKGFAINDDATIVAVSSAMVNYTATQFPLPTDLEFEVRVFQLMNSSHWEIMGLPIPSPDPFTGDYFGYSLDLNAEGTVLAVGANEDRRNGLDSGRAHTYIWNGNMWDALGEPISGIAGSSFGNAVALTDDAGVLMVGAPGRGINGPNSGEAAVYRISGVS